MPARTPHRAPAAASNGRTRLAALRARLAALEGLPPRPADDRTASWLVPFAADVRLAALAGALPWGGLPRRALHEVSADRSSGAAAATGFCAALLGALAAHAAAPVLWVARDATLYAPGLAALGLDPAWLMVACARRDRDILWAMEEGLRTAALAAVLGEVDSAGLLASRRLQLAAEASGVTALLLRRAKAGTQAPPSAAVTRWRIEPAPGADTGDSPPAARWQVSLLRCRGGRPGQWTIDHPLTSRSHAAPTDRLPLPPRLRDRPARARAAAG